MISASLYRACDKEFKVESLVGAKAVEGGWDLEFSGGLHLHVPLAPDGYEPKPSNFVSLYGKNVSCGGIIRGAVIEGHEFYYRTPLQQCLHRRREHEKYDEDRKQEFETKREQLDRDYEGLPELFRRRIDKFRGNNPEFRWQYEGYEMFVCVEAVKIAKAFAAKTPEDIKAFNEMGLDKQKELMPHLAYDEHSGNTFGAAIALASWFVSDHPEGVIKLHGALAPLVGSDEYGCVPRRPPKVNRKRSSSEVGFVPTL